MRRLALILAITLAIAHPALAHEVTARGPQNYHDLLTTWGLEPLSIIGLVLTAWLYTQGLSRIWKSAGRNHGIKTWEAACYALGWFSLAIALVSPLHPWGQVLFTAHMTQHEILMLISAPLIVLGRPMVVFLRALPSSWASNLAYLSNRSWWRATWQSISNPFSAWLIGAAILWLWHVPALFDATLRSDWVHALQHTSFLGSALLFWWAVIHVKDKTMGYGAAILYMFTTALHSGLLGALLAFSRNVWYPSYQTTTQSWGLTPLQDQQLGGLIMWIPAGVVYIIAGLALAAGWIRDSEERALQLDNQTRALAQQSV
jgi:cytochrome c oxidase assembly factor CtaG